MDSNAFSNRLIRVGETHQCPFTIIELLFIHKWFLFIYSRMIFCFIPFTMWNFFPFFFCSIFYVLKMAKHSKLFMTICGFSNWFFPFGSFFFVSVDPFVLCRFSLIHHKNENETKSFTLSHECKKIKKINVKLQIKL